MNTPTLTTSTKLCKFISYVVMSFILLGIVSVILLGIIHNNPVCKNIANSTNTNVTNYFRVHVNIDNRTKMTHYCIYQSTKDILKNSIIIITSSILGITIISCIALIIFDQCLLNENEEIMIEGNDDEENNLLINDVPYKDYLHHTF